jgi:hypothetical protein
MAACTRVKRFDCNLWPGSNVDCAGCEHEYDEEAECPVCFEPNMPMGALGKVLHYRCNACGMEYHEHVS